MDHVRQTPGVEFVGVFDRHAHLREKAGARLTNSVPLFDDPEKMIKACKPDALIVTAPNNEHRALVELAARHRIHCLVQKPMVTTAADARVMQKAAAAAGITLLVNYYPLWQPVRHELLTCAKPGNPRAPAGESPCPRLHPNPFIARHESILAPFHPRHRGRC